MRIFNVMMSRGLGGIQQCYVDYNDALSMHNNQIINIASIGAKINKQLPADYKVPNLNSWCLFSKLYIAFLIWYHKPDIIICHGNRAINFCNFFKKRHCKLVGVSHNYSYKHLKKCDYILTLTEKLKDHLIKNGVDKNKFLPITNMLRVEKDYKPYTVHKKEIIIGSVGRFVEKKGFIYLIKAIYLLRKKNIYIKLLIGGDGQEEDNLRKEVSKLNLKDHVQFLGWVENMPKFWNQIDIFCLPSLEEPFGIIVLEAMEASKPVICTKSGGPEEIIRHEIDGLLTNVKSAEELASAIYKLAESPEVAEQYSSSAYNRLKDDYDIKVVSCKLNETLQLVLSS